MHVCTHGCSVQAADQVRTQGASNVSFDSAVVGNGAGFDYFAQQASQPSERDMLTSVELPTAEVASQRAKLLSMQAESGQSAEEDDAGAAERSMSPEAVFQREVQETLLRTMLLAEESNTATSSMTENAVIELNGLKIAGKQQRTLYVPSTSLRLHGSICHALDAVHARHGQYLLPAKYTPSFTTTGTSDFEAAKIAVW